MKAVKVDRTNEYILTINIIEYDGYNINVVDSLCKDGNMSDNTLIGLCRDIAHINNCSHIFINDKEISLTEEAV